MYRLKKLNKKLLQFFKNNINTAFKYSGRKTKQGFEKYHVFLEKKNE